MDITAVNRILAYQTSTPQPLGKEETEEIEAVKQSIIAHISNNVRAQHMFYASFTLSEAKTANQAQVIQPFMLKSTCRLDNGRLRRVSKAKLKKQTDLGLLDVLPLEILQAVFDNYTDISSLTKLRRVNRRLRSVVDSLFIYSKLIIHVPNVIRATLSIEAGTNFTCNDLWNVLTTKECAYCERYGIFFYILTCTRVCFSCGMNNNNCFLVSLKEVSSFLNISADDLISHGVVPGRTITWKRKPYYMTERLSVVDASSAAKVASDIHGIPEDFFRQILLLMKIFIPYTQMPSFATLRDATPSMIALRILRGRGNFISPHRHSMCLIGLPWLDASNEFYPIVDTGVTCLSCVTDHRAALPNFADGMWGNRSVLRRSQVTFTHRDFVAHFVHCPGSLRDFLRMHKKGVLESLVAD